MNFNHLSAVFLLTIASFSCKNQQNTVNKPLQPAPPIVVVEKDTCCAEKWAYSEGNLTIEGQESPCRFQKIVFTSQIAKTNPKGGFEPMHELAKLAPLIFIPDFKVNGRVFDGMIIGVIDNNGKEDTLLKYNIIESMLQGTRFVRADDGKWHTFDDPYPFKIPPSDNPLIGPNQTQKDTGEAKSSVGKKPVVYLYPTQETSVNIHVNFKGELTHTYPKYNPAQGWTVTAKPDGELRDENTGKIYYNLFWEGKSAHQYDLSTGFVVKSEDVADFLDASLAKLGLNRREANEFITYWLPEMEQNKYNLVHFSTSEYVAQAPLEVTPKADTEIRIFMVYQPLDAPINIAPQTLESPARKGFTLVEWGGTKQEKPEN
jgi:hypothetical protein